jgi:hypothetical protein
MQVLWFDAPHRLTLSGFDQRWMSGLSRFSSVCTMRRTHTASGSVARRYKLVEINCDMIVDQACMLGARSDCAADDALHA